jgi:hypothetical protein
VATTVCYCATSSLDGYIAEADDSLDWLINYGSSPSSSSLAWSSGAAAKLGLS